MKLAFITPRYGADIVSGAEHACRLLAEHLSRRHEIDVLTTCARDPRSWKNEYAEGQDRVRGVRVRRFPVAPDSDPSGALSLRARLLTEPHSRAEELEWVRQTGPWSPDLLEHLERQHRTFDALVFFSMWHSTTVRGLEIAPERSILFPHVHLQDALRFDLWGDVLSAPRALGFLSSSEPHLLRDYVHLAPRPYELVGIGIDPPPRESYPRLQQNPADTHVDEEAPVDADDAEVAADDAHLAARGVPFRRRHRLYGPFALYGGRVEPDNGCEEMLDYFDTYASGDGDLSLVLMGVKMMNVPAEPYLRQAGMLPDRERMVAYEAADLTIAPSSDDLVAQPLLEGLAVGTPVLASARNLSAVEHCRQARAGLSYATREEFVEGLRLLVTDDRLRETLGNNGRAYVEQQYRWDAVIGRFEKLVQRVKPR